MERTPSNFNIVKVLEKKKRIVIAVIKGTIEIPFSMYVHKRTLIPPFNAIDLYKKKKRKEKQKTSMTVEKSKRFQSMVQRKGLRRPSSKKFHYAPRA